jgi:hemoglobin
MKNDISNLPDIELLVNTFYSSIRADKHLGPIFNERIGDKWPEHLEKMYRFWQTILLDEYTYQGRPFPPHANLPVDESHFKQWLAIFEQTVKENFEGEKANEAIWRAGKMAEMFNYKINYMRENNTTPIP